MSRCCGSWAGGRADPTSTNFFTYGDYNKISILRDENLQAYWIITIVSLLLAGMAFTILPMIVVRGRAAVYMKLLPLHSYFRKVDSFPVRFTPPTVEEWRMMLCYETSKCFFFCCKSQ